MQDLAAYLERIGYTGRVQADEQVLRDLHYLHPLAIPFENINTFCGLPVPLDLASLEEKLISQRRGGYCFEQNALFAAALKNFGFSVTPLAARVVWGQDGQYDNPRTHMTLLVAIDATNFICDVGFGGLSCTAPLRLQTDLVQSTSHERFCIKACEDGYELAVELPDGWMPMYRFDLQPQTAIDYEMANHYVCTHPKSHFRVGLSIGRALESGRYALRDQVFTHYSSGGTKTERVLESAAEIRSVLAERFAIRVPEETIFDTHVNRMLASSRANA